MASTKQEISSAVVFYSRGLGQLLTFPQLLRLLPPDTVGTPAKIFSLWEKAGEEFVLKNDTLNERRRNVLFDKKWHTFVRCSWLFRCAPFVDFVVAAGSLALGNIHESSDFDVIVGTRQGRIFTARFFTVLLFGLFGIRRKRLDHKAMSNDKVCLNHFVTPARYVLAEPYDAYWAYLYRNLVPLFGDKETVSAFISLNRWASPRSVRDDARWSHRNKCILARFVEWLLSGTIGALTERYLRWVQVRRIERHLHEDTLGFKPRFRYDDLELEFHPDTERIQKLLRLVYTNE